MKKQQGLSLVELMVALALGLIVTTALISVFVMSTQAFRTQDSFAQLQENARFALTTIARDVRMAGYRGCLGGRNDTAIPVPMINNLASAGQYANNFAVGLQSFHATGTTWSPSLDASISGATPAPSAGSDVITMRFATGPGMPLSAIMASSSADVPLASNAGLSVGKAVLIADCVVSTVFKVTAINADQSVSHIADGVSNATTNLGRAFSTDASVMPISTVTYYVGPSSSAPTGTEKSLWQQIDGVNNELAEGVENMQFLFGEDSNTDLSPDRYVTADQVANFDNVIAVKLALLVRTIDDNIAVTAPKYTFNGVANLTPADRRVRRTFNLTISLRNRTN